MTDIQCKCGEVVLEVEPPVVASIICFCGDCQEAIKGMKTLASTPCNLQRVDYKVTCVSQME